VEGRAHLIEVLTRARDRGFLGPGDPADHRDHALGFAEAAEAVLERSPLSVADLGTGGGVPGLVLATVWPGAEIALIESSVRRADALREWVGELHFTDRVEVVDLRAEDYAHEDRREDFDLVAARSFAAPAVTAEIGTGLARVGGLLVVSEPPDPQDRWPADRLAGLGLAPARPVVARGAHYACLRKVRAADPGTPRRRGRAGKRPLW